MSFSLYDATVPNYLQILRATSKVLRKGESYFSENNLDLKELTSVRCDTRSKIEGKFPGLLCSGNISNLTSTLFMHTYSLYSYPAGKL